MSKLYACIISPDAKRDKDRLILVASQFSFSIEMLDDGVLFDVSGLEKLIGKPALIARKILSEIQKQNVSGSVAVAENIDTCLLLARENKGSDDTIALPETFQQMSLHELNIRPDTLNVFDELGIRKVGDLLDVPQDALIGRYGREFKDVIDVIEQKGSSMLTPNVKESRVDWRYELDFAVDDFEQLIFIINHGLDDLLGQIEHLGLSTEQLDIAFKLADKRSRNYGIKTSFPTLEKTFWLKLINLRVSLAPPEAAIMAVKIIAHFTKPRPNQKGLYAVSRPESESLLLTINKLKKLVGEDNVGVPVLLDERLSEAFTLNSELIPQGKESLDNKTEKAIIAFSYFTPPLRAEVLVRDARLVFIKTRNFSGHVLKYSGVWKANSKWWDRSWSTQEWDVEVENNGIYRLCKVNNEWFLAGEYD